MRLDFLVRCGGMFLHLVVLACFHHPEMLRIMGCCWWHGTRDSFSDVRASKMGGCNDVRIEVENTCYDGSDQPNWVEVEKQLIAISTRIKCKAIKEAAQQCVVKGV